MKSVVGYGLSIAGLVIMAGGLGTLGIDVSFLNSFGSWTVTIIGIVFIAIGIFFVTKNSPRKDSFEKEVPIYEGEGKKRKIVGYRRIG